MQPNSDAGAAGGLRSEGLVAEGFIPRQHPQLHSPSDATLVARCRRGDAASWDALVSRYERLVFGIALRTGLDREDAADVAQSTFLRLLDSIDDLRDGERLVSWLVTVTRRGAWRVHERRAHGPTVAAEPTPLEHERVDPVGEWVEADWVHSGLQRLDAPCRDLLIALYLDPAMPSYAEVARRLGRPIGAIGPTRARCLERMRHLLDVADR